MIPLKEKSMVIRDYPRYDSNPFTEKFVRRMVSRGRNTEVSFVRRDGIVKSPRGKGIADDDLILGIERLVDREQFVKIYLGMMMVFNRLSRKAALLFTIMVKMLGKDQTVLYLVPSEMMKLMDCSEPTYYRALSELLSCELVARSSGSTIKYFINPAFIYNGNRLTLVYRFFTDDKASKKVDIDTSDVGYMLENYPGNELNLGDEIE